MYVFWIKYLFCIFTTFNKVNKCLCLPFSPHKFLSGYSRAWANPVIVKSDGRGHKPLRWASEGVARSCFYRCANERPKGAGGTRLCLWLHCNGAAEEPLPEHRQKWLGSKITRKGERIQVTVELQNLLQVLAMPEAQSWTVFRCLFCQHLNKHPMYWLSDSAWVTLNSGDKHAASRGKTLVRFLMWNQYLENRYF